LQQGALESSSVATGTEEEKEKGLGLHWPHAEDIRQIHSQEGLRAEPIDEA